MTEPGKEDGCNRFLWVLLALCLALFVGLRARWIPHLLAWDEAMNLCTVRAFKAGAEDFFSHWFWRHPPGFCLFMLLLRPLQAGFAERCEMLALGFAVVNVLILFALNRKLYGPRTALWSTYLLAVMPGSVFFDVWVKRDHPVVTFGLLALVLLFSGRCLYAGICLGAALLFKETAAFYLVGAVVLWCLGAAGTRKFKDLAALAGLPVLVSGWWYVGVRGILATDTTGSAGPLHARLLDGFLYHVGFAVGKDTGWSHPWHYYFGRLVDDLGVLGIVVALAGLLLVVSRRRESTSQKLWPLALLVPALAGLSVLRSKVPWVVLVLLPAWASLQAVALGSALAALERRIATHRVAGRASVRRALLAGVATVAVLFLAWPVARRNYEDVLRRMDRGPGWGASASKEAAELVDRMADDGDRVLVTSFHYWKGLSPGHPCAVFAYYLQKDVGIVMRSHERPFEKLADDVRRHRIDWALLSPEPGKMAAEVLGGFSTGQGAERHDTKGAVLFRTGIDRGGP